MTESDWDKLADEYTRRDFPRGDWIYGYQPVLNLLKDVEGKRILDYGCGSGKFSRELARRGAQVIAVDPNERMLALARSQNCHGIDYQRIVDNDISFLTSIDNAVATYVLCTRKDDEEAAKILQQIQGKLPSGGSLVVLDPHPSKREGKGAGVPLEIYLEGMKSPVFDYWRPIEKYVSLFQDVGLSVEEILEPKDEQEKPQMLIIKGRKCIK